MAAQVARPGLLANLLGQLDVPPDARLAGVTTSVDAEGFTVWTVTYRSAQPASEMPPRMPTPAPAAGLVPQQAWDGYASLPPEPEPLASAQLAPLSRAQLAGPAADASGVLPLPNSSALVSPLVGGGPFGMPFSTLPNGMAINRLFPLRAAVKTYPWGLVGSNSLVGRLASANNPDFSLEEQTPYAELWMGTHPSGPSMVVLETPWRTTTPLYDWLKQNPQFHGAAVRTASGTLERRASMAKMERVGLSFLFKVLSIRTALSIQAHPDKSLAAMLHAKHPDIYKDDNHKPEMALAVAPMEALCSFQKVYSILENLRSCPELVELVGADAVAALSAAAEKVAPLYPVRPLARRSLPNIKAKPPPAAAPAAAGASLDERLAEGGRDAAVSVSAPLPSVAPPGSPPAPETPPPDGGAGVPRCATGEGGGPAEESERTKHVKPALQLVYSRLLNADTEAVKVQLNILLRRIAATSKMMRTPTDELAVRARRRHAPRAAVHRSTRLSHTPTAPAHRCGSTSSTPATSACSASICSTTRGSSRGRRSSSRRTSRTRTSRASASSAWPPPTTSSAPASRPSSRTSRRSVGCSRTSTGRRAS